MFVCDSYQLIVNDDLQKTVDNLEKYVRIESWKYCKRCKIVEPNKMMPNYGSQKFMFVNNSTCEKDRYFVPMVRYFYISIFLSSQLLKLQLSQ